jgi:hypothetical protein
VGVHKLGLMVLWGIKGMGVAQLRRVRIVMRLPLNLGPGREIGCRDRVTRWGLFLMRGVQDHILFLSL